MTWEQWAFFYVLGAIFAVMFLVKIWLEKHYPTP